MSERRKATPDQPLSVGERVARGKAARAVVSRVSHGEWAPAAGRVDPIALLEQQATTRVAELVPIRYGRMASSPFAYYRGAALPMAADLASTQPVGPRCSAVWGRALVELRRLRGAGPDPRCSTSMTSTKRTPARSIGTSSGWPPASRSPARSINLNKNANVARSWRPRPAPTARRSEPSPAMGNLDVWYTRLDVDATM